ncbi:MAG: TIGR03790 family protein [Acidobacteria bacterium]|nr:MAG: TIGR03790 family protein [Acidobacteriota bacterium]
MIGAGRRFPVIRSVSGRNLARGLALLGVLVAAAPVRAQLRDDVLIVVNDNSVDSLQVGQYYADRRGIDPANICHVSVPDNFFLEWDEFRSLRDQIIAFLQENTFPPGVTPVTCTDGDPPWYCQASMDQVRQNTRIRYIVMTRGVPTRTLVTGSLLPYASSTSVDNYLKYWLVRYFPQDTILNFPERRRAFADGRGMRTVDTAADGELIVGRIDGLTLESAQALVDRAIDAEQKGIYGKLYGSKYGSTGGVARWYDYQSFRYVYGDVNTSWRYQLGLVGEDRSECIDFLDQPASSASGKAPAHCRARLTSGNDPPPGRASSREPDPFDGLFYLGSLDGQATTGSFADFQNWRRDETCTVTLCRNAADPAACRAASTDVFREIATDCMGVADGFWGYNFQSFPVSYFTVWPTAWYENGGTSFTGLGGGSTHLLGFPDVRDDLGRTDSHSLWYRKADEIADPRCYLPGDDFSGPPTESCRDRRRPRINQRVTFTPRTVDTANPQVYRFGIWYRTESISPTCSLRARLWVREVDGGSTAIDYGYKTIATLPATVDWTYGEVSYQLDPALHTRADLQYDGLRILLDTSCAFSGALGLDDASLKEDGDPAELFVNTSFDAGHEQVSGGDHAANFLSRLNGVGFFGSLSHHESGGHSFDQHPQETLLYFLRGLPYGDAAWWAENHNSGIVYGDPLYSPVAVHLAYLNDADRVLDPLAPLRGDTVNGHDPALVDTTYTVDYCPGTDFYQCDRDASWMTTGVSGTGGQRDQLLGLWDTTGLSFGDYTLRLAVTSTRLADGRTQSFYDYYPVTVGFAVPEVTGLIVEGKSPTRIAWDTLGSVLYDVAGGNLSDLLATGGFSAATCLIDDTFQTEYFDLRPAPPPGDAYWYLVRGNTGSWGNAEGPIDDPRNALDLGGPCS